MKHEKSLQYFQQAQKCMVGGVNSPVRSFKAVGGNPLVIRKGTKTKIFDHDNNAYTDYCLSWGALMLGHAHASAVQAIKESAEIGNKIVVLIDDAYFGLVYKKGVYMESIFSQLADLHENVLAVKIDGATKEDYVWGFRVGFVSYGIKEGNKELYEALESKTSGAVRGNISNDSNLSQSLVLNAFSSPTYKDEKKEKYELLKSRYDGIKRVLEDKKFSEFFTPLPYNSGYFMCIKLKDGINAEKVRQILLKKYDTGVICMPPLLRIAFSAVARENIKELFDNIYKACKEST